MSNCIVLKLLPLDSEYLIGDYNSIIGNHTFSDVPSPLQSWEKNAEQLNAVELCIYGTYKNTTTSHFSVSWLHYENT
jgi:hypothetical protein